MAERWIDSLGDSLFFLRDRVERVLPRVKDAIDQAARKEELDRRRERLRAWAATWKSPRSAIKNNTTLVTVMMLAVIGGVLYALFRQIVPAQQVGRVWFYDMNSKELFHAGDQIPPISRGGGRDNAVRAYVFSCGECNEKHKRFIGYLETFPLEAHLALANPAGYGGVGDNPMLGQAQVRAVDGDKWLSISSDEGVAAANAFRTKCGEGKRAKPCED